jgi:hypothetical protein
MNANPQKSRNWIGLFLIVLGVLFLLDTLEVFGENTNLIGEIWPLFIIAVGFIGWAKRGFTFTIGPIVVMVIGGLLLIGTVTDSNPWRLWPVLLILLGMSLVWRQRTSSSHKGQAVTGEGSVNINAMFGGTEHRISGTFKGGQVTAFMGDGDLDLKSATLNPEGAVLDLNVIMGGLEMKN